MFKETLSSLSISFNQFSNSAFILFQCTQKTEKQLMCHKKCHMSIFYCNHFLILILFTYVHFSSGLYHLILYNGLNNFSAVYCILSNQLVMKSSDYHPWIYQASPLAFFSTFKLMTLISKTKYFTS